MTMQKGYLPCSGGTLRCCFLMSQRWCSLCIELVIGVVSCICCQYVLCSGYVFLHLLGNMIFADKSSTNVQIYYLQYLNDLNPRGEYALGVVALAYLYNQLSYANFYDNKLIGGYMTLLMVKFLFVFVYIIICLLILYDTKNIFHGIQAWVFEHLQTIPYCEKPKTSDHKKSLAARWKPLRGSGTTNLTRFK